MVQSSDDCVPKSDSDTSTRQPSYLASHHHHHYHRHVHHGGSRTSKIPIPVSPATRIQYTRSSTPTNAGCFGYNRMPRQGKSAGSGPPPTPPSGAATVPYPLAQQAQRYLEQNIQAWLQPSARDHTFSAYTMNPSVEFPRYPLYTHITNPGITVTGITQKVLQEHNLAQMYQAVQVLPQQDIQAAPTYLHSVPTRGPFPHSLSFSGYSHHSVIQGTSYSSPCATGYSLTQPSAAASFFARAAQRLNLSSKKKRQDRGGQLSDVPFRTCFHEILRVSPPPAPPGLLRVTGRKDAGIGKVKVMLRICPISDTSDSFLSLDGRKKQVTVYDPSSCGTSTPAERRAGVAAPKMFAFDAVFSQDDTQAEVCSNSLTDVVQSVVNGNDGCLFVYGHSGLGKTYTMLGNSDSVQDLGVIPCAISWLFKLINEHKQKTGARFSVRVSAVEVSGRQETLKDLLSDYALGGDGNCTSPGVYLRDDPIFGSQLMNQSELRAPTAEKAAYLLDAAVAARSTECEEDSRNSHFLFTLHVYQYRVEKGCKGGVAGGRSRLHLFDLGSCEKQTKGRDSSPSVCLSLSALGNVILALFNGQKHVPYKDSKLTQVLREALGGVTCRAAMIAHVSAVPQHYAETLATIQLAARVHRMRRKKIKYFSPSSGDGEERGVIRLQGSSGDELVRSGSSDPDYSSSSEQSCDTVIYVGSGGLPLSDRELTDNEGPPSILPKTGITKVETVSVKHESNKVTKNQPSSLTVPSVHTPKPNREDKIKTVKQFPNEAGPKQMSIAINERSQKPFTVVQLPRKIHLKHPVWPLPKPDVPDGSKRRSDETWVDGPRFTKPKFDTRTLQRLQKEQWVDGPAIYGYMDDQKQDMIHKWIEEHSRQPQENLQEVWVDCRPADDLLNGILEKYVPDEPLEYQEPIVADNVEPSETECVSSDSESDALRRTDVVKQFDLLSEESCAGICNSLQNISAIPDLQEGKQSCGDDDTSSTSADVDDLENDYDEADDQDELEDPVPTQDSCLQVTEEDIISALLAAKEQFGELDIESFDGSDHPLHILSEEDLNLASSFTDSCSVSVDLETVSVPDTSPGVTWALLQGKLFQKSSQTTGMQHSLLAEKLKAIAGYHDGMDLEDEIWISPGRVSKTCSLPAHLAQLAVSQLLNRQEPDLSSICSEPAELNIKRFPWYIQSSNGIKWDNKLQRVSLSVDHAFHAKPTQIVPPLICLTRDHNKNIEDDSKFCNPQVTSTQVSKVSTVKPVGEVKSSNVQLKNLEVSTQLDDSLDSSLPEPEGDKLKPADNEMEVYSSESPRCKPSRLSKFLGVKGKKEKSGKKRTHRSNDTSRCTLTSVRGQGSDSDTVTSGYPSPYTKAWVFRHSSSGHGSDSSLTSADIRETKELLGKSVKVQQFSGTSSGYESMPRDSEGTPLSSSSQDSSGRGSGKKDGRMKGSRKKDSNKRSRSAPARQTASPRSLKNHPSFVDQQPAMTDEQKIKSWNERTATRNEDEACCSGLLCCRFLDFY